MKHPYIGLPEYQFWRRGISDVEPQDVDPVIDPRFMIEPTERVGTAGSCFAQHIARRLASNGFNYYIPESGKEYDERERSHRGFGVFSARYGNIYTVRQLHQLFLEAHGKRPCSESPWVRSDGRFVDPLRPNIEPSGFSSRAEVILQRELHLEYVRSVFKYSDVFVYTLGLTEGWVSRSSGDVFPLAPGVGGGQWDPTLYKPHNFGIDEVRDDLINFLNDLKLVNPSVRVVLTVSPVPLIATFEKKHTLVSNTYSKSVLRVAAEAAIDKFSWVDYFPSYEIITGNFNAGRYFEDDLREINQVGVAHAMRCFLNNYTQTISKNYETEGLLAEYRHISDVICDEAAIEKVSF